MTPKKVKDAYEKMHEFFKNMGVKCQNCKGIGYIPYQNYKYPRVDENVHVCHICKGSGRIK